MPYNGGNSNFSCQIIIICCYHACFVGGRLPRQHEWRGDRSDLHGPQITLDKFVGNNVPRCILCNAKLVFNVRQQAAHSTQSALRAKAEEGVSLGGSHLPINCCWCWFPSKSHPFNSHFHAFSLSVVIVVVVMAHCHKRCSLHIFAFLFNFNYINMCM